MTRKEKQRKHYNVVKSTYSVNVITQRLTCYINQWVVFTWYYNVLNQGCPKWIPGAKFGPIFGGHPAACWARTYWQKLYFLLEFQKFEEIKTSKNEILLWDRAGSVVPSPNKAVEKSVKLFWMHSVEYLTTMTKWPLVCNPPCWLSFYMQPSVRKVWTPLF